MPGWEAQKEAYEARSAASSDGQGGRLVSLLVFGDSYVCDPLVSRTWPILLGENFGWRAANFAVPGSSSSTLGRQLEHAAHKVSTGELELHPSAWALVHTGGNDVMRGSASELGVLIRTALTAAFCSADSRARTLSDTITDRVAALVEGLESLGVRNLLLVGMPLTASVPAVAQMTRALAGAECGSLGGLVLRRLNGFHLERLKAMAREVQAADGLALCLDEAAAIDASLRALARREYQKVGQGEEPDSFWRDGTRRSPRAQLARPPPASCSVTRSRSLGRRYAPLASGPRGAGRRGGAARAARARRRRARRRRGGRARAARGRRRGERGATERADALVPALALAAAVLQDREPVDTARTAEPAVMLHDSHSYSWFLFSST